MASSISLGGGRRLSETGPGGGLSRNRKTVLQEKGRLQGAGFVPVQGVRGQAVPRLSDMSTSVFEEVCGKGVSAGVEVSPEGRLRVCNHFSLVLGPDGDWWLKDLGNWNGTQDDGRRFARVALRPASVIRGGNSLFGLLRVRAGATIGFVHTAGGRLCVSAQSDGR